MIDNILINNLRNKIHRIIEFQLGKDIKDHMVQSFLAKAWCAKDGPAES